ncbi:unnamed protein product [Soboliphyme baturini]|uniref:Lysophospholipid acyltransferase 5 n=1 Tax=Soboliphyme baturini TaxID=241478 RepID=A0A183J7C6_9BILA|nr:unnamed protein product [Soboliphyme baturini]
MMISWLRSNPCDSDVISTINRLIGHCHSACHCCTIYGLNWCFCNFMCNCLILAWSMGWKLAHLLVWFRVIVFRYQAVWLIAEGSCILSGIAHNLDPKTGEQLWDGVRNIRLTKFEFCASFQSMIESFNYNTNQWAAKYVFKKLKFLGNKSLSHIITLLFLSLWHGTYSGYFVCFGLEYVCVIAERKVSFFVYICVYIFMIKAAYFRVLLLLKVY